jgi:hypothetical protein
MVVYNSVSTPGLGTGNIACWDETSLATGTAIAAASNTPQIWDTNGTNIFLIYLLFFSLYLC